MTTPDTNRPAEVDPLVLVARPSVGRRLLGGTVDAAAPIALVAGAIAMAAAGDPSIAWVLLILALVVTAIVVVLLARTGRTPGAALAGLRTVEAASGAAAGGSILRDLVSGRLRTADLRRGRDPFAPALAPYVFPEPGPAPETGPITLRGRAPSIELDSGQRLTLDTPLVLGRDPSPSVLDDELYRWPDLSRTLSKSHARLEWDGRLVWVTDLGSTNGTVLRAAGAPQTLLPHQRTPLPASATLELGDRIVTVRSA
ncbi:hypothetical protein GCM10022200_22960 [Microbacterium awajiense]|uniref:FHA domain-containing protein n=1 Tax=Microbacterium awajiense TaxID=415214 RepID=A0ABP7ASZ8_9MICO